MRLIRVVTVGLLVHLVALAGVAGAPRVRVLIVDGFSNHDWRLTTALIRGILEPTGLFEVGVSTAPETRDAPGWDAWRPRFADHDVVIQTCNDIGGGPSWPRAVQEDFEAFVRSGGGVYVWHAGNNAFPDWPAYNEMIGLGWRTKDFGDAIAVGPDGRLTRIPAGEGLGTGHGDRLDTVVHRLGDHPIHAGLPCAWLTPDIEVYYYARGPARNLEVLSHGHDPHTGKHWPLEWVVRHGRGRIYTSTFGHVWHGDMQPERMRCAGVQTVVVRALQWLAGRTPDLPVPADFPTAEAMSVRGEIAIPHDATRPGALPTGPPPVVADRVTPAVPVVAEPFDPAAVTLGPGPFRDAMERDRILLLRLDPERLLHSFRLNVGLPSAARPYGGWEAPHVELRGHTAGHYLSACALMYQSTGDEVFRRRVETMVEGFAACQAAAERAGYGAGYLSAFPESFIDRVEAGQPVWAPWYTLHKIMAGLLDAHRLAGSDRAREVLLAMTGWVASRVERLDEAGMQAMLANEFGGMNDLLAAVYALTGDARHLRLARAFEHAAVFAPLAAGRDELDGLHANTQIPKITGAARLHRLTGEPRYRAIATHFWERVALHRSYAIGGNSDREHFFPPADFARHIGAETAETCNTHNMLKLTGELFTLSPGARLMDFYERGLYNHILASQDPALGTFVYLMALEPGHFKTYSTVEDSFWCCVGTGMENHAKYGEWIFARGGDTFFVNLFIPAQVEWREQGVVLAQATRFPDEASTEISVVSGGPATFTLRVRHPAWVEGHLALTLNGEPLAAVATAADGYVSVRRTWHNGDRLGIALPMALRAEPLPGTDDVVALFHGPIALAAGLGTDGMPSPYAGFQLEHVRHPHPDVPVLVSDRDDWLDEIERVSTSPLLYRTRGLARPHDVVLRPFHTLHHERMALYWTRMGSATWEAREAAVAAVEARLEAMRAHAIDRVDAGDATSEAAHGFAGDNTRAGAFGGRTWRLAIQSGYFEYTLATGGREDLALVCVVGARDRDRHYDVVVGDVRLEPPRFEATAPGEVRVFPLPLPAAALAGRDTIRVRLAARGAWDHATASLFECMLVSSETLQHTTADLP